MQQWWLVPLGFVAGAYGTVIGVGGGFLLVPALLLLYPKASPDTITSISLAVVFFNAASGSMVYGSRGRIDYKSGFLFAAATVPGAILGALSTGYVPRRWFTLAFAVLMLMVGLYLLLRPGGAVARPRNGPPRACLCRSVVERNGRVRVFCYNPWTAILLSAAVGYFSSLLGIGGGIIHVPALVMLLNFPVHIATATSQFVLAIMALVGTLVHVATGAFHEGVRRTAALALGALVGAQVGARLAERVHGEWILRGLGLGLLLVGIRLVST